ncbi:MAG: hypothetical protein H5U10_04170 [Desulfacinum sp.]|nr:hypothetical protein [Desulfacinum sp.]MBZ4658625.1 hypothetical protein [Desulfacinum sp.]
MGLSTLDLWGKLPQPANVMELREVHAQEQSETPPPRPSSQADPNEAPRPIHEEVLLTPEMMAHLKEQKEQLRQKEQELTEREAYLRQMEEEIESRLKELIALQEKIQKAQEEIRIYREEQEQARSAQIRALAKIYGNMKPKEAGELMQNLEDDLVVKIISLMTADQAAKILSSMEVKKAAKISKALTAN